MKFDISYDFSLFSPHDIYHFKEGTHYKLYEKLGSHIIKSKSKDGVYFALWAPNAKYVSVIADFNGWSKERHPLKLRDDDSGIWEGFIEGVESNSPYKYYIESKHNDFVAEKSDPYAKYWEVRPNSASKTYQVNFDKFDDKKWMESRANFNSPDKPISIYELHLGSWKRGFDNAELDYRELADELAPYLNKLGFTHIELLPITEHPFDGSWGYQCIGYFAPTSRYGAPEDFIYFINKMHNSGIGVILDWVPSHFAVDMHGLGFFDGTNLYEHQDPRQGFHPDWKSSIFNLGRNEVKEFLISSALYWVEKFHIDGIRVDAVASMLYLDYAREDGEWIPNRYGGKENIESIEFLRDLNHTIYTNYPDVMMIAEESTSWPMVTKPPYLGGLGFGFKWNMGWMHDTLSYFKKDPIHRKYHQDELTFSLIYAFHENFVLSLSHDEVVHMKGSMINKMAGDYWQKFANLRALYGYMFSHPGKKLLFMGCEIAQFSEWNYKGSLDWNLLDFPMHSSMLKLIEDLNRIYKSEKALYRYEFEDRGFEWIDTSDSESSVISYIRKGESKEESIVVICNLTPIVRNNYRVGVPFKGDYEEIFNSDSEIYGGGNVVNKMVSSEEVEMHSRENSITLTLPPLATIFLKPRFK